MDFDEQTLSESAVHLMEERNKARAAGNWEESDRLRGELEAVGVLVHDTPEGTTWTLT